MSSRVVTVWYRIVDWPTASGIDESGGPLPGPGGVGLLLRRYEVLKETPCGVWLRTSWSLLGSLAVEDCEPDRRWCRRDARRRFACPTIEEALESFAARKRKQASIYEARAKYARRALNEALRRYGQTKAADISMLGEEAA